MGVDLYNTCLLFQVLIAPIAAMLLRSVSRRLLSSSTDSSTATPPSWEITDWEKDETVPYVFKDRADGQC